MTRLPSLLIIFHHAVVLAVGVGSQLRPLTDAVHRALLPVANRPIITYPLQMLEKSGFTTIHVIVSADAEADLRKYLNGQYKSECKSRATVCPVMNLPPCSIVSSRLTLT